MDYDIKKQTLDINKAADFLGFKNARSLQVKVRKGEIPAFKAGRQWMFYLPDLVDYIRSKYSAAGKTAQVNTGDNVWHLAKQKIVHITKRDSQLQALEFKNQRAAVIEEKRKSMRISENER